MKSYYWIKLYHEILDDAKMGRLPDRLWRRAIELFLMAGEEHEDGNLPPLADIAWRLRLGKDELRQDLEALAEVEIVTQLEDGTWFVTNFAERQSAMSNSERQQRYRDRKRKDRYYGDADDTEQSHGNNGNVTRCNADIDIDKEVEVDVDREVEVEADHHHNCFSLYEQAGGVLTKITADQLADLVDEYEGHRKGLPPPSEGHKRTGDEWVQAAIEEAARANARISINYITAILDRWKRDGFEARRKRKSEAVTEEDRMRYQEWAQ